MYVVSTVMGGVPLCQRSVPWQTRLQSHQECAMDYKDMAERKRVYCRVSSARVQASVVVHDPCAHTYTHTHTLSRRCASHCHEWQQSSALSSYTHTHRRAHATISRVCHEWEGCGGPGWRHCHAHVLSHTTHWTAGSCVSTRAAAARTAAHLPALPPHSAYCAARERKQWSTSQCVERDGRTPTTRTRFPFCHQHMLAYQGSRAYSADSPIL